MSSSIESEEDIPKTSTTKKRIQHRYTDRQRLTLCLINLFFDIDHVNSTAIFNTIYSKQLEAQSFEEGLQPQTIRSQLHEARHFKGTYRKYSALSDMSLQDLRRRYQDHRNEIEDVACNMHIQLKLRIPSQSPKRPLKLPTVRPVYQVDKSPAFEIPNDQNSEDEYHRPCKLRRVKSTGDMPQDTSAPQIPENPLRLKFSSPESLEYLRNNKAFRRILYGERVLLKRRTNEDGDKLWQRDALLFRTTTLQSAAQFGYRAGTFKNSSVMDPPAEDNELKNYVINHLKREQAYSPLISLYAGPRPVFSRALRADQASSARILILDFERLEKSLKKRYPESKQSIYWVGKLIADFGLPMGLNDHGICECLLKAVLPSNYAVESLCALRFPAHANECSNCLVAWSTIEDAVIFDFPVTVLKNRSEAGVMLADLLQFELLCSGKDKSIPPERFHRNAPKMNRDTGNKIGEFLNRIESYFCLKESSSNDYREVMAYKIAKSWKFKGCENPSYKTYVEYMTGVFEVSRKSTSMRPLLDLENGRSALDSEDDVEFRVGENEKSVISNTSSQMVTVTQSHVYDIDSDDEQELLDLQLEANNVEFNSKAVEKSKATQTVSQSIFSLTEHSDRAVTRDAIDDFTRQMLISAEEPTPTPQPDPISAERGDANSSGSDIIDLTLEDDDSASGGGDNNDKEYDDLEDIIVVSTATRKRSVLSIRTLSLTPGLDGRVGSRQTTMN